VSFKKYAASLREEGEQALLQSKSITKIALKKTLNMRIYFVGAPYMLIVLSPLFVQLMHTNYYKIVKQLKSFKIIIFAPNIFRFT